MYLAKFDNNRLSIMGTADVELNCYTDCDDGTVSIPKNEFRSQFSWKCYEASRHYVTAGLLTWLAGPVFALRSVDCSCKLSLTCFVTFLFCFMLSIVLWSMIYGKVRKNKVYRLVSNNVDLLAEAVEKIFDAEQNNLPLSWARVASELNATLYATGKWKTPYCFFDGMLCEKYFRSFVLKPNFATNVVEKNCSNVGVDAYKQTVYRQFNLAKNELIVPLDKTLPRDFYWKKPIWRVWESLKRSRVLQGHLLIWVCNYCKNPKPRNLLQIAWSIYAYVVEELPNLTKPSEDTSTNRIRFLATIAAVAPGNDIDRWDEVARSMNAYFERNCTTGSFFDGKHCSNYYFKHINILTKRIFQDDIATYELVPLILEVTNASALGGVK